MTAVGSGTSCKYTGEGRQEDWSGGSGTVLENGATFDGTHVFMSSYHTVQPHCRILVAAAQLNTGSRQAALILVEASLRVVLLLVPVVASSPVVPESTSLQTYQLQ